MLLAEHELPFCRAYPKDVLRKCPKCKLIIGDYLTRGLCRRCSYQRKKSNGLCTQCQELADGNHVLCVKCREKAKEYGKKRRRRLGKLPTKRMCGMLKREYLDKGIDDNLGMSSGDLAAKLQAENLKKNLGFTEIKPNHISMRKSRRKNASQLQVRPSSTSLTPTIEEAEVIKGLISRLGKDNARRWIETWLPR